MAAVELAKAAPLLEAVPRQSRLEATSAQQTIPPFSPSAATATPPAADAPAAFSAPPATVNSKALAEANSRIAAVESERDTLAAEVARLERQEKSSPPQQANPAPSPTTASLTSRDPEPLVPEPGLDLSAASASLPQGMPARVLIRYAGHSADARRSAESLANALIAQGVEVADRRESAGAIRTEVSFSYAPDEAIALRIGRLVGVTPVRRLQAKDALMARPGTVDLSLSGESHLAAIKTTSTTESNHE